MGVAVLQPQDCLKGPLSRNSLVPTQAKHPRNPNPNPSLNRQKRSQPNRRRRSPPRHQAACSPPTSALPPPCVSVPKVSKKKNNGNNPHHLVVGQVRILKRGEEIAKTTTDLVVEDPDLGSTRRIGPEPEMVPTQTRLSDPKSSPASFYAGPVTFTSPPPSDLPFPAKFTKKSVSVFKSDDAANDDATSDLIRILRLDI